MTTLTREKVLEQWDYWRRQIYLGDTSSAPRDWFESVLDNFIEAELQQGEPPLFHEDSCACHTAHSKMELHLCNCKLLRPPLANDARVKEQFIKEFDPEPLPSLHGEAHWRWKDKLEGYRAGYVAAAVIGKGLK